MFGHRVLFYESDAFLLRAVRDFVEPAQRAGDGVIVIATRDHLVPLPVMLDADPAAERGEAGGPDYVFLDARETLAAFMVDGLPNEARFIDVVGGLMGQVSANGGRHVSAFGEMVAVLNAEGNSEAALLLEQFWANLAEHHRFRLLCAYPLSDFPDDRHRPAFQAICASHSHVDPIESLDGCTGPDELHRRIALLQQRANALEAMQGVVDAQTRRITAMSAAQAELEDLAGQDALTGLSNRRTFTDRLSHAVDRAARSGKPLALIYIDIDDFKILNDTHGHVAGDQVLKRLAARLSTSVRAADTACRLGGDEFAVILEDADAALATVIVQRILSALDEPFVLADVSIEVSASIGLSVYPHDSADAVALVQNADADMYRAKRSAKARDVEAAAHDVRHAASQGRRVRVH